MTHNLICQGVHPSIRDFRRSVAKELVGLQEKVDHITQKKAEIASQQDSHVEGMDVKADLCNKRDHQQEEKQGQQGSVAESEPVYEFHREVACQAENNRTPQESIPEATAETKSLHDDPKLDADSNSQTSVMPMNVADESEISLEPISRPGPAETELEKTQIFHQVDDQVINPAFGGMSSLQENVVSELKDLVEFPKGDVSEDVSTADNLGQNEPAQDRASEEDVLNDLSRGVLEEYNDMKDNNTLVKDNQGADDVLAESYLEPELAQLPVGVLDDDCESPVMRVDVNAERADGEVHDMNHVETALKVPVTVGRNASLGCAEQKDNNNAELLKKADLESEDIVQASEEEASFKSVDVSPVVHGEEKMESCTDDEIPAVTTTNTPETCEEEELSFLEREGVNVSGNDSKNSSNKDELQECGSPVKLSKSGDVEHEEKQNNDNFEQQASGEAGGIETTCDSGVLEAELLDQRECYSPKAKQGEEQVLPPPSPSASEISLESDGFSDGDRKLVEENMRLREMMQKLIESGQDQLTAISKLSSRVKELEKRMSKKKKLRMRKHIIARPSSRSSCFRPLHDPKKVNAVAMAM